MTALHRLRLFSLFVFLAVAGGASADSWIFDPVKKDRIEIFGNSRIVLTTDARHDRQYPDFILSIFYKDKLRAKYRGVAFQKIFASPDNSVFLGISNSGLPGTAVVIFNNDGSLMLEVKHGIAAFNYCEESVTLKRQWFDENNPDVKFVADEKYGGYKSITLRDCKGNTTDVMATILQAYNRSFQRLSNSSNR